MDPNSQSNPTPGSTVQPSTPAPASAPNPLDTAAASAIAASVVEQIKPVAAQIAAETTNSILADFERSHFGQDVVKFFDSAVGKSLQTLLWTVGAFLLTIIGARVANIHLDARLVSLGIPGLLNWILYTAKVFADSKVPKVPKAAQPAPTTTPSSTV